MLYNITDDAKPIFPLPIRDIASDGKTYQVEHYNIEMITSIGYQVKSQRGKVYK